MKVFVTGASGQLGSALAAALGPMFVSMPDLDITDATAVDDAIGRARPGAVINAAAMTDVDGCESHPDQARAVNAIGAGNVARAAAAHGAFAIHISTDAVFDGTLTGRAYVEDDEPNPLNVYATTKLEGERLVLQAAAGAAVVRTAWVYSPVGKNLLSLVIRSVQDPKPLEIVGTHVGSPTWAPDLSAALVELATRPVAGIFHVAGQGECTRFEFARAAFEAGGLDPLLIEQSDDEPNWPAARPRRSPLEGRAWVGAGFSPMRDWRDALADAVAEVTT